MRLVFLFIICLSFFSLKAQIYAPLSPFSYGPANRFGHYHLMNDSNSLEKKWSVTKYAALSSSWLFMNGANGNVISAPIGLQVNRRLNNNLYAFAGASVAPAYFNFNRPIPATAGNKNFLAVPGINSNGFGMSSRIEAGLMYVNDERTFSISGSIGIERNNYPFYPATRSISQQPRIGAKQ